MELGKDLLYLSQAEVESLGMSLAEVIDLMEVCFSEKGAGQTEMPPKIGVFTRPNSLLHAMPAWFKRLDIAGLKWVGCYNENKPKGFPKITGLLVLNDADTGVPYAIMDSVWITAVRTGAVSGLSAKYLARPESKIAGVIGAGIQGRTNLEALLTVLPDLQKVFVYDHRLSNSQRYVEEMRTKFDLEFVATEDPYELVKDADVIASCGPTVREREIAVIEKGWLKKGCTVVTVDGDQQFKRGIITEEVSLVTTDGIGQYRNVLNEPGGAKDMPYAPVLLEDIIHGRHPGRQNDNEITFSANHGLGLTDIIVAKAIYELAIERGVGTKLKL